MSKATLLSFCPKIVAIGTLMWFLCAVPAVTEIDVSIGFLIYLYLTAPTLLLIWLTITFTGLPNVSFRLRWWWIIVPLTCILNLVLSKTDWGFQLRFALSEEALNTYVAENQNGVIPQEAPRWIGLLWIEKTSEYDGMLFFWMKRGFLDRYGVAFVPAPKEDPPRMKLRQLHDRWHTFVWRF